VVVYRCLGRLCFLTYFTHVTTCVAADIFYERTYIKVKNRFRNQVKDNRSYPGADLNSDHNLVMMKYNLKFKRIVENKNMAQ